MQSDKRYELFTEIQSERGIDVERVKAELKRLAIETPSWGYGDSGTRFKVFQQTGVPRNPFEKFEDAAIVHQLTRACPTVALHIPWDVVEDFAALKEHAEALGVGIGAINPNLFQDADYIYGSVCNISPEVRLKATAHLLECVDIMAATDSNLLSLWFADGTNYPGQANLMHRKHWMEECLAQVYGRLQPEQRMLIEYKFYEPAFYHTDLADWGMAFNLANKLGPQAEVLVDTGHHAQGTNVEHIVAYLLDEHKLGGFHFNARKYGDDDLIVGSTNPYELFLIFAQINLAKHSRSTGQVQHCADRIAYMIDQSHNIEPKIPAMIRSVMNVQTQFAKSLLINWDELNTAQNARDVLRAEAAVREAYEIDPSPLLSVVREELGAAQDPMAAYMASGYAEKILERGVGGASW